MVKEEKMQLIQAAYNQHWLHARHVELERLMFTSILTAIIVGVLVGIKNSIFEETSIPLLFFLMIVSFFGMLFSLKAASIFKLHGYWAKKILKENDLEKYIQKPNKAFWINKYCRISKIFPIFFLFFFIFLLVSILYNLLQNPILSGILFGVIFLILAYFIYNIDLSDSIHPAEKPEKGQYD